MKSKRSLRFFSNTLTAAGLALAVSACSTVYQDDWNQNSGVPDLNDPNQRSDALLAYCKKLHDRGDTTSPWESAIGRTRSTRPIRSR